MSIYRVNKNDVEQFSVVTNPIQSYTSSSINGSTGAVNVFARRSNIVKDMNSVSSFIDSTNSDVDINSALRAVQWAGRSARQQNDLSSSVKFYGMLDDYLDQVAATEVNASQQTQLDVVRFTPDVKFSSNTVRKLIVKDNLVGYYRTVYPTSHWAYTNYNTVNFFTSSTVPTSSVLLYPNVACSASLANAGHVSGIYVPSGAFSFDFYVNPRYQQDSPDRPFKAGTICHLSSTFALSLVSGSAKDENGKSIGFRLQLQLSHSADIPPSLALPCVNRAGYAPGNLVFLSNDNVLKWNNWHHVVVRWGTNAINDGTGSFNVDSKDQGFFVVPSGTVAPVSFQGGNRSDPDVLCVGNYYEGLNANSGSLSYFFAADPALRDGLIEINGVTGIETPNNFAFNHPLNAEIHDLAIRRKYVSDADIAVSSSIGPSYLNDDTYAFYLPPFFTEDSPFRQSVNGTGGVFQTPFEEIDGTTVDPFNVALSFGVAGHYINIENFTKDFANAVFPRLHHMTGVAIQNTTDLETANSFLYAQPFVRRRNLFIMPCDDGNFIPSYFLLLSESMHDKMVDDMGILQPSFITLDNMVSTASLLFGTDFGEDTTFSDIMTGYTPEQPGLNPGPASAGFANMVANSIAAGAYEPGVQAGAPLSIYQRTRDPSSNEVTFFDVSNLFYGTRIMPTTISLQDAALSGSGGAVKVTLVDDGYGTLYRSDSFTKTANWNCVGNAFYDEGILTVKSPHLYFFGQEAYSLDFRGTQNVHVMKIDVMAPANQLNSSSNPTYLQLPPSTDPNESDTGYVYITGVNFHDSNFNVVMKTQLAQPIFKRFGDKLLFRVKQDF